MNAIEAQGRDSVRGTEFHLTVVAWLGLCTFLLVFFVGRSYASESPAETLLRSTRPLVIGHRGAAAFAPENTLASFQSALAMGADLVELDYHQSKDNELIVIHDSTLDRTTDAQHHWGGTNLKVADYSLEELRKLDAGLWFRPAFPQSQLPTLEEAMSFIQSNGVTLIERKQGDPSSCITLLKKRGWTNRAIVQAFDWNFLREYHVIEPSQVLAALGPPGAKDGRKLSDPEKQLNARWLEEVKSLGARVAVWNRQVDEQSINLAHALGLKVWVYTVNDQKETLRLLACGADGIITDHLPIIWKTIATMPKHSGLAR